MAAILNVVIPIFPPKMTHIVCINFLRIQVSKSCQNSIQFLRYRRNSKIDIFMVAILFMQIRQSASLNFQWEHHFSETRDSNGDFDTIPALPWGEGAWWTFRAHGLIATRINLIVSAPLNVSQSQCFVSAYGCLLYSPKLSFDYGLLYLKFPPFPVLTYNF